MPHSRYDWESRIKVAEREYQAVRVALDWLLSSPPPDEVHRLTTARGWDDLAVAGAYDAHRTLDAVYLIRMYSVFERAVSSYWRLLPGNAHKKLKGNVMLKEVGDNRSILMEVTRNAQDVRVHRNNLVHERIDDHAAMMAFADARGYLLTYLDKLPDSWG